MAREIMMVIRHGVIKKVWIDPKDIYDKSDIPFVPPDYPTKEMLKERDERLAEKAVLREADKKKQEHDDWNEKPIEPKVAIESKPGVKPVAKETPKKETKPKTKQRKGMRK